MADSKIDYLLASPGYLPGKVFSPWIGCDKCDEHSNIREGCRHCWAWAWAGRSKRFAGHWGKDAPRYFMSDSYWQKPLRWQKQCERAGKRMRVLAGAMCDVFERLDRPQLTTTRARLWWLIGQTPLIDWLLLTKRPENIRSMLPTGKHGSWTPELAPTTTAWPPPNLHLGVSIWDQPSADRNIPPLLEVPAALRWVSYEPALGPADVSRYLDPENCGKDCHRDSRCRICIHRSSVDWVVIGCESRGPRPGRPCDVQWMEKVVTQCAVTGIPCYVKQLPDIRPGKNRLVKSAKLAREGWPTQLPDVRLLAPQRSQETVSRGGRAASRTGRDPA